MKQLFLSLLLLMSATTLCAAKAKKPVIDRIDPAFWYAGMKNPRLQLLVYGPGIAQVKSVTTDYPGVRVDSVVALDSPNYLFVYLNVREAQPGQMTLNFKSQTSNLKPQIFELKAREMKGEERRGFDISDVLYLLMPDRFAQGMDHSKPTPTAAN